MSQLRTTWLCIATEGETVDGREILPEEIIEMAETYDPDLYTAMIWPRHNKRGENRGDPLGEVLELRADTDESDTLRLYAVLRPFVRLLEMNSQNRGVFTSVEMDTDFRNSGVTYLEGLAVTDTPASVGTTRLDFSRQKQRKRKMAKPAKKTWRQHFGIEEVKEEKPTETTVDDEVLSGMAADLAAALTKIAELETMLEQAQSDVEVVKDVVDTEDFAKLRDNLPEITKSFSKVATQLPEKNPAGRKEFVHL
ncbi:GPO family capsid scaffolding protein [Providencia sp. PROV230]|uniref:GPO family capsid scaffolding protein n=1 Tax=Providencia sp. PROV230 TaxID=2949922 RepID=UPI00234B24A2|nr:GPO family capsid scaffolding protein [Providencia sp. PROV230]